MRLPVLIAGLLFAVASAAQTADKKEPPSLERLCGKLERVEYVSRKNEPSSLDPKYSNMSNVPLFLYRAESNQACCESLQLADEGKSNHWGNFKLERKGITAGLYWIVACPASSEYRMLVQYAPKKNSTALCGDNVFQVTDKGEFSMARFIVVD